MIHITVNACAYVCSTKLIIKLVIAFGRGKFSGRRKKEKKQLWDFRKKKR